MNNNVTTPVISIVSPVYGAEKIVDALVAAIVESVEKITLSYEIILVEDHSPDNSWAKIVENCQKNTKVKGIKLSRNFGQHFAITAGLDASSGAYVVVMDCDLQDNPKYIQDLYAQAQQGYDIVYTYKEKRAHSFFKNITAGLFFKVFNYLSDTQQSNSNVGSYSMINRKVVNAFCQINDVQRHYLLVLGILGYSSTYIKITHEERYEGKSSYTFKKLINHAINGITSQSDKLLKISTWIGFLFFCFSFLFTLFILGQYFLLGAAPGWTSTMAFMAFSTGLILMAIGVLGIYIAKIFEQVKNRPLFIIDKKINF